MLLISCLFFFSIVSLIVVAYLFSFLRRLTQDEPNLFRFRREKKEEKRREGS